MLQSINRIGQSWVGKVVVTILFMFLIASFAIWGIGDIFRGQVHTQVANVGGTDISADAFRAAYQTEYQNLLRRTRQAITPEQARAIGLDQRVLGRLVTEASLDRKTRDFGLAVSDRQIVQTIQQDPNFQGANGQFDRSVFAEALRSAGYSEAQYLREQRALTARLQLADALTGDLPVPLAMRQAAHRFQAERRVIEYLTLDTGMLGDIPAATEAELQTFYDSRKTSYRAPEYRSLNLLVADAASLAKPDAISPEDARSFYDRVKETRFGSPERRAIQQIVLPTRDEALALSNRIKGGETFDTVAAERHIDDATLNLGTLSKADVFDPAIADAAFGLAEGAVSPPIEGKFGQVLVRVTHVEPGSTKPFEAVEAEARSELALERARDQVQTLHDAIEDQRASARPLADIARERGLSVVSLVTDRQGLGKDGKPIAALASSPALLPAAFRSDVNADNEAVATGSGGYAWFEVTAIEPARDRPLAEVREKVASDWLSDSVTRRLADKARDLTGRLNGGEAIEAVAGGTGGKVETSSELVRGAAVGDLTRPVVTRAFATPVGKAADAAAADDKRVVFRVKSATVPPFVTTTQEAAGLQEQLRTTLGEDVLTEYIGEVQKETGVSVFPENMRRVVGGES